MVNGLAMKISKNPELAEMVEPVSAVKQLQEYFGDHPDLKRLDAAYILENGDQREISIVLANCIVEVSQKVDKLMEIVSTKKPRKTRENKNVKPT
jgi:hypothetical protein